MFTLSWLLESLVSWSLNLALSFVVQNGIINSTYNRIHSDLQPFETMFRDVRPSLLPIFLTSACQNGAYPLTLLLIHIFE